MIPRYGEWDRRYGKQGLTVVGVHSPETDQEADRRNVVTFVKDEEIRWPVVLDPALEAWNQFGVRAWPTALLIDRAGVVREAFIGDGAAKAIERSLRALLSESGSAPGPSPALGAASGSAPGPRDPPPH